MRTSGTDCERRPTGTSTPLARSDTLALAFPAAQKVPSKLAVCPSLLLPATPSYILSRRPQPALALPSPPRACCLLLLFLTLPPPTNSAMPNMSAPHSLATSFHTSTTISSSRNDLSEKATDDLKAANVTPPDGGRTAWLTIAGA